MTILSVVVPAFNVEQYVHACIESLLYQRSQGLEIIVVDDGSTDGTGAIAENLARKEDSIRVIRQANAGLSAARNVGAAVGRGKYLAFCDGDDVVPVDAYLRLIESLEHSGSDMASGDVRRLDSKGLEPHSGYGDVFATSRDRTHIRKDHLLLNDRMAWNKVIRRSFWDDQNLSFSLAAFEDAPVMLEAHVRARMVDVLSTTVYHWRRREVGPPSIMQRMREPVYVAAAVRSVVESTRVLQRLAPELVEPYVQDMFAKDVRNALRSWHVNDAGDLEEAWAFIKTFVSLTPAPVIAGLPSPLQHLAQAIEANDVHRAQTLVEPP